jgi:ATP-dependent helicase/nuclease subunit A
VWQQGFFANGAFEMWLNVWRCGTDSTRQKVSILESVRDLPQASEQLARIAPYLTKAGAWSGTYFKAASAQKALAASGVSESAFEAMNAQMAEATAKYYAMKKDAAAFALHVDVVPCVQALLGVYEAVKERTGTFDFNDVEYHCLSLLSDERTAAYVQIQLDARYQHLLFDEFQDTSPLQWQVIYGWLAAYGADANRPRVFVVGDLKQSIYRFRKADARVFAAAEDLLASQYRADVLETHLTRRNSKAVVEWVNRVFEGANSQLVGFKTQQTTSNVSGHVACLQSEAASSDTTDAQETPLRDWLREPQHTIEATEHDGEATQLAAVIDSLIGRYELVSEDGSARLTEFKDIMVLLQNRVHLAVYERQLREARIPFVSTRKGGLLDTLEALDIMALVAWLMDAHDDLSLLHVLRSPLGGVDEAFVQLLVGRRRELATLGRSTSLWHVGQLDETFPHRDLWGKLSSWQQRAPHMTPHEVMDMVYLEADIFQCYALVTPPWLNEQVQANLRAFLHMALALNAGRYPSLYRYWQALKTWQQQSKNAPSEAMPIEVTNAVQVMTAHGAKGLEAPIVILIDVKETSERERAYHWLIDWPIDALRPAHLSLVASEDYRGQWRQARWQGNETRAAIEKWNLLYVAMTRAQQTLIVSSAQKEKKSKKDSDSGKRTLYEHLHDSAQMLDEAHRFNLSIMERLEVSTDSQSAPTSSYMNRYIQAIQSDEVVNVSQFISKEQVAAQLGILWHAVMDYTTQNWDAPRLAVADIMQKYRASFSDAQIVKQWVETVCTHSELQVWLNPMHFDEAHNEVVIVDALGVVKRLDRWVRRGRSIAVIDYKSDWREADLPLYREQLKDYQNLLSQIYPQYDVSGVLIRADGQWLQVGQV